MVGQQRTKQVVKKAKPRQAPKESKLEEKFAAQLDEAGITGFVREYKFYPGRMWRVDFAHPDLGIMIEIEGGLFGRPIICHNCKKPVINITKNGKRIPVRETGRHNSGAGFIADAEKYGAAALAGWMLIRIPGAWIRDGTGIKVTRIAVDSRQSVGDTWKLPLSEMFTKKPRTKKAKDIEEQ